MEHNTDRILWTVLILAIGVALYVGFRPEANGLLHQGVDKIQDITTNVNSNPSDSSSANSSSSSSSSTNPAVGANLLTGTAKFEFGINNNTYNEQQQPEQQTIQKYDDETNYVQDTTDTPADRMGSWWALTPKVGQVYTLSADVCGNGYITGDYFHYEGADNGNLGRVDLTNNWQRISNTFRVNTINSWSNWICYAHNSNLLKIKHIKIEEGPAATPWVP